MICARSPRAWPRRVAGSSPSRACSHSAHERVGPGDVAAHRGIGIGRAFAEHLVAGRFQRLLGERTLVGWQDLAAFPPAVVAEPEGDLPLRFDRGLRGLVGKVGQDPVELGCAAATGPARPAPDPAPRVPSGRSPPWRPRSGDRPGTGRRTGAAPRCGGRSGSARPAALRQRPCASTTSAPGDRRPAPRTPRLRVEDLDHHLHQLPRQHVHLPHHPGRGDLRFPRQPAPDGTSSATPSSMPPTIRRGYDSPAGTGPALRSHVTDAWGWRLYEVWTAARS